MVDKTPLETAIAELKEAPSVNIKGKQYTQVSSRVEIFRRHFQAPDWGIETAIHSIDDPFVRVIAKITHNGIAVATGLAEENREQGPINRTSAMENAETSAIGRAMAAFGLHGGEYASAGEVDNAIKAQEEGNKDFVKTNLKARSHEIVRELHGCTDMDQLQAFWGSAETKDFLKKSKTHYREGFDAANEAKDKMKDNLTDVAEREAIEGELQPLDAG